MQYTDAQLEKYDLRDRAYAEYVSSKYREAVNYDSSKDALDIADLIEQWYKKFPEEKGNAPELYDAYEVIKWRCCWVALNIMDERRTVALYGGQINELRAMISEFGLEEAGFGFYFSEKLRQNLQLIIGFENRDALKARIRKALEGNQELLFDVPLEIGGKTEKSTIGNWMRYYFQRVGTGELNKLKQSQFFAQDKAFKSLNDKQQEILREIFNTCERIKISSYEEQGIETEVDYEDEKGEGTLIYGQLYRFDPKTEKESEEFLDWYEKNIGKLERAPKKPAPPAGFAATAASAPPPAGAATGTGYLPVEMAEPEDTPRPPRKIENVDNIYETMGKTKTTMYYDKPAVKVADPNAVIRDLVKEVDLKFGSPALKNRFFNISRTYLRGIRDAGAFVSALARPEANGGMDYDIEKATKIQEAMEDISRNPKYKVPPKKVESEPIEEVEDMPTFAQVKGKMKTAASATPESLISLEPVPKKKKMKADFAKSALPAKPPKPKPKPKPKTKPKAPSEAGDVSKGKRKKEYLPVKEAEAPAPPETPPKIDIKPPAPPKPVPKKARPPKKPGPGPAPMPRLRRAAPTDRPVVTDVKTPAPAVMGPIDELKHMDLAEFRTLGSDAEDSAESVLEKVELLLEQGVTEKSKGIRAWKESPLNKKYLEIGQESMDAGKSVEEYIAENLKRDQNGLTLEEFDAIADLNRKLRF